MAQASITRPVFENTVYVATTEGSFTGSDGAIIFTQPWGKAEDCGYVGTHVRERFCRWTDRTFG